MKRPVNNIQTYRYIHTYPKLSSTHLSKICLYRGVVVQPGNVWFKRSYLVLRSIRQGARQKLNYNIMEKCHQAGEVHRFMSYSGGFPLNFRFAMVHIWLPVFRIPCLKIIKIGTLVEKIMLIPIYGSQFALKAIPDYEPLSSSSYHAKGVVPLLFLLAYSRLCKYIPTVNWRNYQNSV